MRIYGNGILKSRSAPFVLMSVHRRPQPLAEDEIVVSAWGPHGETMDMHLSLEMAQSLIEKLQAELLKREAGHD